MVWIGVGEFFELHQRKLVARDLLALRERQVTPEGSARLIDGMPPPSRNQRVPTGGDTPQARAASSLGMPSAIRLQNSRCTPRWLTAGRPGDRIWGRPVCSAPQPLGRPSATSVFEVLQRPLESAQYTSIRYTERLAEAGIEPSVGSKGDSYDNALAETIIGLFKTEVIHRRVPWRGFEDVEFATLNWVW